MKEPDLTEEEKAFYRCQSECLSSPVGFTRCVGRCIREHPEAARIVREKYGAAEDE